MRIRLTVVMMSCMMHMMVRAVPATRRAPSPRAHTGTALRAMALLDIAARPMLTQLLEGCMEPLRGDHLFLASHHPTRQMTTNQQQAQQRLLNNYFEVACSESSLACSESPACHASRVGSTIPYLSTLTQRPARMHPGPACPAPMYA